MAVLNKFRYFYLLTKGTEITAMKSNAEKKKHQKWTNIWKFVVSCYRDIVKSSIIMK